MVVSPCLQFAIAYSSNVDRTFPFDWPASVSNILTVRRWAESKISGRKMRTFDTINMLS